MKLRLFLPTGDRLEGGTALHWILFDARGQVLREERTPLSQLPRGLDAEAILPAERVLFARLKLPRVNAATIRELLPYAVEDRLLADPAHIHAVAGPTNARGETVVAVVDRDWLRAALAAISQAGARTTRVVPESAFLRGEPGEWHIAWGNARGLLVEADGVSATFDTAQSLPLAVRIALDEAAARGELPRAVRVHSQDEAALPDFARWSAEARVPFEAAAPWEEMARGRPAADAIDLLQGDFARRARVAARLPRAAMALAFAILVLQATFAVVDDLRLRKERERLEARREAIFREAFPEARVVVDPDLQMARNLAELRRSRGLASGDGFLAELTRVAHESPGKVRAVEYAGGRLEVR